MNIASSIFQGILEPPSEPMDDEVKVITPPEPEEPAFVDEDFIQDFDAKKYNYDYTSTSTLFDLPSTHKIPILEPNKNYSATIISESDPSFKAEISKIFHQSFSRKRLTSKVKFVDATRVKNTKLHDNLMQCRQMLVNAGENSEFTYLYELAPGFNPIYEDDIFSNGAKCGNLPVKYLGDPSKGVYLSRYPDSCIIAPPIPYIPYRVIIYKALLGHEKLISLKNYPKHENGYNCENAFGSHVAMQLGSHRFFDTFLQSLVYIYDKRDSLHNSSFHSRPRTLYPYAAVTFYIDGFYCPMRSLRLPWFPENKIAETTLNFDPMFRIPVNIYQLYDNSTRLNDFSINGIKVEKMVTFKDFGKWKVLIECFSNNHGNFFEFNQIRIHNGSGISPTNDIFISHCMLTSEDERYVKITRSMIVPQLGAVFSVPGIPKFGSSTELNGFKNFGLLLPNCAFASLFGLPMIPGDILHCFIFHKVSIGSSGHPLRTIMREEMLINATKHNRISRSDKISDNDIRSAFFTSTPTQVFSIDAYLEQYGDPDEKEECRMALLQELGKYDDLILTDDELNNAIMDDENYFQQHLIEEGGLGNNPKVFFKPINYCKKIESTKKYSTTNNFQIKHGNPKSNYETAMEVDAKPTTTIPPQIPFPIGSMKTAVILEPRIILDTQISPSVLETLLRLSSECTENKILSEFTVIYHQCMRNTRLADNLNLHRSNVAPERLAEYQRLEEKYSASQTIQFAEEHICDSKRTSLRAYIVCILTILRKYTFKNAVLLTYAAITDDVPLFRGNKTSLMTPEKYIEMLENQDGSFLCF